MKAYGRNDKEKKYKHNSTYCDCYYCVPVKKNTKKSERQKGKQEIKKELKED